METSGDVNYKTIYMSRHIKDLKGLFSDKGLSISSVTQLISNKMALMKMLCNIPLLSLQKKSVAPGLK